MSSSKPIFAGIRPPHGIILQPIPTPTLWQRLAVWFVVWLFGYLVGLIVGAG